MNFELRILPLVLVAGASLAGFGEKLPFERYQSVVDRMPFGAPPPGFDWNVKPSDSASQPSAAAGPELTVDQQQLQRAVSFSVINVEADGAVMVGFIDNSDPKAAKCHYLRVGETRDGWTVKEADPVKKTMTVEKQGVEVTLDLGAKSAGSPAKPAPGGRLLRPAAPTGARAGSAPAAAPAAAVSPRGRRAAREAEERASQEARVREAAERRQQEAERAEREAAEKAEREAEREAQREQLLKIQEELKRAREERAAREREKAQAEEE